MPLNALKNSKWLLNSQICQIEKKNFDQGPHRSNTTDRLKSKSRECEYVCNPNSKVKTPKQTRYEYGERM